MTFGLQAQVAIEIHELNQAPAHMEQADRNCALGKGKLMFRRLMASVAPTFGVYTTVSTAAKTLLTALTTILASSGLAQAATIDFTDGIFTPVGLSLINAPTQITESVDGITFTITNIPLDIGPLGPLGIEIGSDGLEFDLMNGFALSADADVRLTSLTGIAAPALNVNYSAPGYGPFPIGYATVLSEVDLFGGGVDLEAGQIFSVEGDSISELGFITAIGFDPLEAPDDPEDPISAIPLPAGFPLLLAGLLGLAFLRRSKA